MTGSKPQLSVVVPLYNEEGNVAPLLARLSESLSAYRFEVIAVDDGSRDGTFEKLKDEAKQTPTLRILRFRTNAGQTAALRAGIEASEGDIVVTIDGDLENDPNDIPKLVETLREGFDIVCGWRKDRWRDATFTRKIPSAVANWLIRTTTRVNLHDFGCTLRAYRRELIQELSLYGDMHRFIPAYVVSLGGKITELPVSFQKRVYGESKYGIGRTFKVLLDLLVFVFMTRFLTKPMQFFGGIGVTSLFLSFFTLVLAILFRFWGIADLVETPLPLLASLFLMVGVQLVVFGVLSELMIRSYYEGQGKKPYRVVEKINF